MLHILDDYPIRVFPKSEWPLGLSEIPTPPTQLHIRGSIPTEVKFLCVVGPRKYTEYGKMACQKLISGLAGFPICIVSGLAYGMDSIAHKAAMESGLVTIAFPGSGLGENVIYPSAHIHLAQEILERGGALVSEFDNTFGIQNWMFPQRNRLLAGIADAVLIIEAHEKSGTSITARLATDYNRELCVVPGSIFNDGSMGSNRMIRAGATVVTTSEDILEALRFEPQQTELVFNNLNEEEKILLKNIPEPTSVEELIHRTGMQINEINVLVTGLEIKNIVRVINGKICKK